MSNELQQNSAQIADDKKVETPHDLHMCDMELPFRSTFYPLGYPVDILTNEPAVLEAASESFGHQTSHVSDSILQMRIGVSEGGYSERLIEPVRREYNHLFSLVADAGNQAILDLKRYTNFIWVKRATVDRRLYFRYNFLEKPIYILLGSSVVTDLHAACVSKNERGILLCGNSGAGKSTLAYACARAGWTYISDDTSYLDNHSEAPRVFGHSHRVRFRPNAKVLFSELRDRELTLRLEGKPSIEIPTSELPGIITANESRIHRIIYLNRSESGAGRLVPLPKGTAVQRMCDQLFSSGEIRTMQEKALQAFYSIPIYELQYRDLDHAIYQLDLLVQDI